MRLSAQTQTKCDRSVFGGLKLDFTSVKCISFSLLQHTGGVTLGCPNMETSTGNNTHPFPTALLHPAVNKPTLGNGQFARASKMCIYLSPSTCLCLAAALRFYLWMDCECKSRPPQRVYCTVTLDLDQAQKKWDITNHARLTIMLRMTEITSQICLFHVTLLSFSSELHNTTTNNTLHIQYLECLYRCSLSGTIFSMRSHLLSNTEQTFLLLLTSRFFLLMRLLRLWQTPCGNLTVCKRDLFPQNVFFFSMSFCCLKTCKFTSTFRRLKKRY